MRISPSSMDPLHIYTAAVGCKIIRLQSHKDYKVAKSKWTQKRITCDVDNEYVVSSLFLDVDRYR